MELIYYSYYPYKDPNKVLVKDENGNDLWAQPFRLYKAAVCKSLIDFQSEEDFIRACFEAMDSPEYRIQNYKKGKSYKDGDYGVEVIPTRHFYGATNDYDGVFVITRQPNKGYYVMLIRGLKEEQSWQHAVVTTYRYHSNHYATKLVDFTREK